MSAFDDLVYGAKKCFDAAAVKTTEIIECSRVQLEKAQLNGELKEQYTKLGKLCFEMAESGEDKSVPMRHVMDSIREILEDLKLADENVKSNKPKVCPNCKNENDPEFEFCSRCGTKL